MSPVFVVLIDERFFQLILDHLIAGRLFQLSYEPLSIFALFKFVAVDLVSAQQQQPAVRVVPRFFLEALPHRPGRARALAVRRKRIVTTQENEVIPFAEFPGPRK